MNQRLKQNLRFALPTFLVGFMLCTFGELAELYSQKQLFVMTETNQTLLADFNSFYNAALLSRSFHERGTPLYEFNYQAQSLDRVTAPVKARPTMLSVYPPHFFLLLEPLSYLGIYPAWLAWSGLIVVAMALSIWLLDLSALKTDYEKLCCGIALVCSSPTFSNFRLGQNSFFLLAALLICFRLLESRRFFLAGLSTILSMFKPQYLPVLFTTGLIAGRLPFALGVMTAGLIVFSVSYLAFGWQNLADWPNLMKLGETHPDVANAMQSIRGQVTLLVNGSAESVPHLYLLFFALLSVAFTALLWLRYRKQLSDIYLFRFLAGLSITAAIFGSPHTHVQDYVLFIALAGIWGISYIQKYPSEKPAAKALKILLIALPFVSWVFLVLMNVFLLLRLEPFFLYATAIFFLSLRQLPDAGQPLEKASG